MELMKCAQRLASLVMREVDSPKAKTEGVSLELRHSTSHFVKHSQNDSPLKTRGPSGRSKPLLYNTKLSFNLIIIFNCPLSIINSNGGGDDHGRAARFVDEVRIGDRCRFHLPFPAPVHCEQYYAPQEYGVPDA